MQKFVSISNNLWAISLKQEFPDIHDTYFSCFFLVNQINNEEFAREIATRLIKAGCKNFHFFGSCESVWHLSTDIADIDLGGLEDDEIFVLTYGFATKYSFCEDMVYHYLELNDDDHKYYLFYDDEIMFSDLCRYVKDLSEKT